MWKDIVTYISIYIIIPVAATRGSVGQHRRPARRAHVERRHPDVLDARLAATTGGDFW